MLISNRSGGGEIVAAGEDTRFYDDIGCLAADAASRPERSKVYVRLNGDTFVEAEAAFYARPPGARTPMGSGLVAFRTADEARAADPSGRVLGWNDVLQTRGEK